MWNLVVKKIVPWSVANDLNNKQLSLVYSFIDPVDDLDWSLRYKIA